jgi:tetratricopeptide (TPR) repeat protein
VNDPKLKIETPRLAVLLWLTLFDVSALAEPPPASSPPALQHEPDACTDSDDKCYELYETARSQSAAGQYDAALINYQNAYARKPVPWLLISIGRMQQKLLRHPQAIASYRRYLALPRNVSDPELRTKAQIYLNQVLDQLEDQKLLQNPEQPVQGAGPPIYKKWWFWTSILGSATVLAIGLGVGLTQREQGCQAQGNVRCFSWGR